MPKVHNSNNLSKDDICKFYEFVCAYEKDYNKSRKISMEAEIREDLLWGLLEAIINTRP